MSVGVQIFIFMGSVLLVVSDYSYNGIWSFLKTCDLSECFVPCDFYSPVDFDRHSK